MLRSFVQVCPIISSRILSSQGIILTIQPGLMAKYSSGFALYLFSSAITMDVAHDMSRLVCVQSSSEKWTTTSRGLSTFSVVLCICSSPAASLGWQRSILGGLSCSKRPDRKLSLAACLKADSLGSSVRKSCLPSSRINLHNFLASTALKTDGRRLFGITFDRIARHQPPTTAGKCCKMILSIGASSPIAIQPLLYLYLCLIFCISPAFLMTVIHYVSAF